MKTLEFFFIVLGLYSEDHGMVGNYMYDENRDEYFNMMENEECKNSHWWEGAEPFWITAVKQVHVVFTFQSYWFMVLVFNATFNNISAISWRSVLLVGEIGVPGENHRSVASH